MDTQLCAQQTPLAHSEFRAHNTPPSDFLMVGSQAAALLHSLPFPHPPTMPTGNCEHVPSTRLHALHCPVHAESQQKPSTQFPLSQTPPIIWHTCPLHRFTHPASAHSWHDLQTPVASQNPGLPLSCTQSRLRTAVWHAFSSPPGHSPTTSSVQRFWSSMHMHGTAPPAPLALTMPPTPPVPPMPPAAPAPPPAPRFGGARSSGLNGLIAQPFAAIVTSDAPTIATLIQYTRPMLGFTTRLEKQRR
jgi:hypothetical protein